MTRIWPRREPEERAEDQAEEQAEERHIERKRKAEWAATSGGLVVSQERLGFSLGLDSVSFLV